MMLRSLLRPRHSSARAARLSTSPRDAAWPSVSIVGVGQMGAAVACNLLKNGVEVTLQDVSYDANVPAPLRDELRLPATPTGGLPAQVEGGPAWVENGAEAAARSEVLITALPKPEHVTAAFECKGGILEGLRSGSTWIEHSTTDFENTLRLKDLAEAKGVGVVEAPLTGGMQLLREGKMVALVGAKTEVLEGRIASLIALSAPRIVRCGEFGHATIIKIHSNMLCAVLDATAGEMLCVAKKAGLDMKLVFDAMRVSSGNSFMWETEVPLVLRGEYDPNFTAEMMAKDISLGLDLARRHGVPQPINTRIAALYEEAMEKYGSQQGSVIPMRLNEDAAGVRLSEGEGNASAEFAKWSYTTEITNGSFQILGQGLRNPYLEEPFTLHSDTKSTP